MIWVLSVIGLIALVAIATLARLIETTFVRLGRERAAGLDDADGTADAKHSLSKLVDNRDVVLGPAAALSISAQVTAVVWVAIVVSNRSGRVASLLTAIGIALLLLLGEGVARRWGVEANDRMARRLAKPARALQRLWPLSLLARLLSWLVGFFGPHSHAESTSDVVEPELVALAEAAAKARLIEDDEANLIGSIIELGDTLVRGVMVPRPDMKTISRSKTVAQALELVVETGYTRLPVTGEDTDDIVGIAHAKDLISAQLQGESERPCSEVMRAATFVPETKHVAQLMREMQDAQSHLAVAVDEYGGTAGVVSLEDIIEELVGEITDEFDDDEPLMQERNDGSLLLSARMSVAQVAEVLNIEVPEGDWETLGGLVLDLAGHVPKPGDVIDLNGTELVAAEVDGRRVRTVMVAAPERNTTA